MRTVVEMIGSYYCITLMLVGILTSGRYYHAADSARILAVMPIAAKSHWNVVDSVLQTLVARGHHVTAITPFPKKSPVANYTEVDMSRLMPSGVSVPWDKVMGECSVHNNLPFLSSRHKDMCRTMYEYDEFWSAIKTNKQGVHIIIYICI
ncbi:PREDICTED: uncharacterized protein LOC107173289 [Diuraphis noxia]|uniref:uncharacterized protein LOC107173289 n=1 Tax=Diuraphis noxia TaxID=143948 RepID=UPI0007637D62|nr:PREDICTED: uncharacterized protein LOC107173289 [Diuraphis noxia]XP_015379252.1 PREDICTED: uncharacterized protein LOC107173289 [Diuraphis noxia]XP_015379253.1 PREDICTED: uncharacterized protein LOC107173289 [Diuraphis noxia]XP_015379254.1 PREDICTED: uncharacterized protein LOC107173289 [Diuraphis noxia]XP_015379255.1 PREDICTED: uncharacterized protein LOC107173289 [Diuraphis noxia]XP_015379256.1 PREDICTED: uncharacterized protein LOC107173289 [Diuraphis noxia]XP_015379257.1 PREDICTED: unc